MCPVECRMALDLFWVPTKSTRAREADGALILEMDFPTAKLQDTAGGLGRP